MQTAGFEAPLGGSTGDENFFAGSQLLPARKRPHVAAFYALARAADDIADNPKRSPEGEIARLERSEAAVTGPETGDPALLKAHRVRESLAETGVGAAHCVDLLAASRQDATKRRYADRADLMGCCELSAKPVGCFLLDLQGEAREAYPAADAVCKVLRVINRLQDAQADVPSLDRVCLPLDWLDAEGLDVTALDAPRSAGRTCGSVLRRFRRPGCGGSAGRPRRLDARAGRALHAPRQDW